MDKGTDGRVDAFSKYSHIYVIVSHLLNSFPENLEMLFLRLHRSEMGTFPENPHHLDYGFFALFTIRGRPAWFSIDRVGFTPATPRTPVLHMTRQAWSGFLHHKSIPDVVQNRRIEPQFLQPSSVPPHMAEPELPVAVVGAGVEITVGIQKEGLEPGAAVFPDGTDRTLERQYSEVVPYKLLPVSFVF